MPELALSLQFARRLPDAALHRAALPRHRAARWLRAALDEALQAAEITVRVVGEDEGRQLNRDFRGKDYATNVLTFDYCHAPVLQADLVLDKPLADHYAHLLVHGALHAQGWDHETSEADAEAMEAQETRILAALGVPNPYERG